MAFDPNSVEAGITGTQFAGSIKHFASVGSTNALALEAAQADARTGVWVADEQTAGRGRGGHGWHSVAGDGLYVSVLVTPPLTIGQALWISLATGIAAQASIRETTGLNTDIRWPNDLLIDGRKCGGILVETSVSPAGVTSDAMLRYAVIGVGINLNHSGFPDDIARIATSLKLAAGREIAREPLLASLLRHLDQELQLLVCGESGTNDGQHLLDRFAKASSWVKGKHVRVEEYGGYTGITSGLDGLGFLLVDGDDGVRRTVLSGGVREI